uniref:Skp1_POZ domain-containing protein n=1 Tax=Panagrellus redivivus TaxID=6233 RepID=A0A7E4VM77_PANRE
MTVLPADAPKPYPHKYVKLLSNDGHEFVLQADVVFQSGTIKEILTGENGTYSDKVYFRGVEHDTLSVVSKYLMYKFYCKGQSFYDNIPQNPYKAREFKIAVKYLKIY